MSTPAELLQQSLTALRNAKRFSAPSQSYRKDNPAEYAKVIAYLDGGARPSGVTTEMGKHALLEEDARRSLDIPVPPDPPNWQGPITISADGTYEGAWESTTSAPAVTVSTSQPVTIRGYVRKGASGGTIIDAIPGGAVNLTIENLRAYGPAGWNGSPRFFWCENHNSLTIRNCTIENTGGIEINNGPIGCTTVLTRNRHLNIVGNATGGVVTSLGNFVQFRHVYSGSHEVSWNEIVNEYGKSMPEDIVSIFHTSNVHMFDNMLWHQSALNNTPGSSQNGITIDSSDGPPGCNNNRIERNQVVAGFGILTFVTGGGNNNQLIENRIVADQYVAPGIQKANGSGGPLWIKPGGTGNYARGNTVGYVDRFGTRFDFDAATLAGAQNGGAASNAENIHYPGVVDATAQQAEWTHWQQKLAAAGVTIGA